MTSVQRRPFLVCIHDVTPAYAHETNAMLRDLAPLLGRTLSLGVVPNWCGEWPLESHPDFCAVVRERADELLLHGYSHRRERGCGPTTLLAEGSDEMNGLDVAETSETLECGQRVFTKAFGARARGFLAPAWQLGHVRMRDGTSLGLDHVLGFFSAQSAQGRSIPLTTWTWDCGRWGWLGHIGHGVGWLSHSLERGVPTLAIHPRDIERGYWPRIMSLTLQLLRDGYEPTTVAGLLETDVC